jgi:hypothetical protein
MQPNEEISQINKQRKSSAQEEAYHQKKVSTIEKERGGQYGAIFNSHKQIGEQFRVILSAHYAIDLPPIPSHVCAAMLLGLKLIRCITPVGKFQMDDFYDMQNYMDFTRRMDPKNPEATDEDLGKISK